MNTKETKAVLYSVSQGCFHLESLQEYILSNLIDIEFGKSSDYKLIGVFETEYAADLYIERIEKQLKQIN